MTTKNYSELIAWQKTMDLVQAVYKAAQRFPREELYGLTNQVRRASVSVPPNTAGGQGRKSINEFLHHSSIAYGSLREVETQVLIAGRLSYLGQPEVQHLMTLAGEVGGLINGLSNSLSNK